LKNNIQSKRTAIKGLVNLALHKQEIRTSILAQLSDEVIAVQNGTSDPVVTSFVKALLRGNITNY